MSVDETRPLDIDPVVDWPTYIRAIAAYLNDTATLVGGEWVCSVTAQNVSTTLTTLNKAYTVNSGSAVTLTLPEVVAANIGNFVEVHKLGVGNLTVTAGGSDTIAAGGAGTSIVNSTAGEAKAANVILRCVAAGQWMVKSLLGTWV